jgi:hypothetical protein
MTPPVVVCADPGSRWTGLVVRQGDDYLGHELLRRRSKGRIPERAFLGFLIGRIDVLVVAVRQLDGRDPLLAFEHARGPTGFKHGEGEPLNPVDMFALGMVIGALLDAFPDAIQVPPGDNGGGLLACYPAQLRGPRERGPVGHGRHRHCRSAWDAAAQAERLPRLHAALAVATRPADAEPAAAQPAQVISQGGLATSTRGLALIRPARRQGHHRADPEGGDAA